MSEKPIRFVTPEEDRPMRCPDCEKRGRDPLGPVCDECRRDIRRAVAKAMCNGAAKQGRLAFDS